MKILFLDIDGVLNAHEFDPEVMCGQIHAGCPETEECRKCGGEGEKFIGIDQGGIPMGKVKNEDGVYLTVYGSGYRRCQACNETGRVPHPLLAQMRSEGPHYRGMWSLDLLIGKG